MSNLRKAAEDLLEGVEGAIKAGVWKVDGACDPDSAIVRLRQALEHEEKPPVKSYCGGKPNYCTPVDAVSMSQERVDETAKGGHEYVLDCPRCGHCCPERKWVGLTDEELDEAMKYWSDDSRSTYGGAIIADGEYVNMRDTWRYIEAKLKEKNT